jgi:hypothetical protein
MLDEAVWDIGLATLIYAVIFECAVGFLAEIWGLVSPEWMATWLWTCAATSGGGICLWLFQNGIGHSRSNGVFLIYFLRLAILSLDACAVAALWHPLLFRSGRILNLCVQSIGVLTTSAFLALIIKRSVP